MEEKQNDVNLDIRQDEKQTENFGKLSVSAMPKKRKWFTTEKLVVISMFSALAFVVSYLEFPIFPATPWLKLDFGNMFIMLIGFLYGPVEGIVACVCKELLCIIFKTHTAGIGELANVIVMVAYILLPSIYYRRKKGFKFVVVFLALASVLQTAVALVANRFLLYPLFMQDAAYDVFKSTWYFVALFNLIKSVAVSILTMLVYKKLSKFLCSMRK